MKTVAEACADYVGNMEKPIHFPFTFPELYSMFLMENVTYELIEF